MCRGQKNQTHAISHEARKRNPEELGTGLFSIPAPERGILERRVIMVPDLTYVATVKRGHLCEAFKWIAGSVKSYETLQKQATEGHDCGNCGPDPGNPACTSDDCMCSAVGEDCYR
jgi:hypothetical protein